MKKKVVSALLAATMAASLLAGCGSTTSSTSGSSASGTESTSDGSAASGETEKVVMEFIYFDAVPADLEAVEAAINEITVPEIGVELEYYPISMSDAMTQISLLISSGGGLDIVIPFSQTNFMSMVNKNLLLAVDDLAAEYAPEALEAEADVIGGGYANGVLYGFPSFGKIGNTYGLVVTQEAVDAAGWTKFEGVTLDDMDEFCAAVKAALPDKAVIQANGGSSSALTYADYFYPVDYLGADAACGGIFLDDAVNGDTTVVNIFATEEYADYCQHAYEWAQKGYFNADALTNQESQQSGVTAGTACGYFLETQLGMATSQGQANGVDMTALNTTSHYLTQQQLEGHTMCIPYNSEHPEAAMKFLNMLFTNADLLKLVYYGIEGQNYTETDGVYDYVEGQNAQENGYHQWFGLYGNQCLINEWQMPVSYMDERTEFNSLADATVSPLLGYTFDSSQVSNEYAAVNDVITTYRSALECGNAGDPTEALAKFNEALEAAGINTIIEQNQKDLDEWLASQN